MAENPEAWWVASQRKQYQEDTFKWLHEQFLAVSRKIDEQGEWQVAQAKEFAQNTAELLSATLTHTRDSVVIWLGIIAVVALASAGLWFGVGGVALILIWIWRRNLRAARALWLINRFRNDCFRELLELAEHGSFGEKVLDEDKKVVLKCRDSILYPLAVAPDRREKARTYDLEQIDTLYREYCSGLSHVHLAHSYPAYSLEKCGLCMAVKRLREHVEGVLSKFESQIEAARTDLLARIDGHDSEEAIHAVAFLTQYCEWERGGLPQDPESEALSSLLKSLRDKENWTFDEADKVRELCRTEGSGHRGFGEFETRERATKMFDLLTAEMESSAKRCGVEETWQLYDTNKNWLFGSGPPFNAAGIQPVLKDVRRAFERHNPEATIRELSHPVGGGLSDLTPLKSYGFDVKMVNQELQAARKLVRKEEGERWRKRLMFETAKAWLWQAEEASERVAPKDW